MRPCTVFVIAILAAVSSVRQQANGAEHIPAVTVEPPCPEWTKPPLGRQIPPAVVVSYNSRSPEARLKTPGSVTLVIARSYGSLGTRFESEMVPMTAMANGTWRVEYTPARNISTYSIFFFTDDRGRVDNNHTRYWETLSCKDGQPEMDAIVAQASTYDGRLLAPGIQRAPDLAHAIDILKSDHTHDYNGSLWQYELKIGGGSASAYERVGRELETYITAHTNKPDDLFSAVLFVAPEQQKLPPNVIEQLRKALAALPDTAQLTQHDGLGRTFLVPRDDSKLAMRIIGALRERAMNMSAELDFWPISNQEAPLQKKAEDYLAFIAKYPESRRVRDAYWSVFRCHSLLKDVPGAESVFEKLTALDPLDPYPLLAMAEFYNEEKTKPDRALQLAEKVAGLHSESQSAASHRHFTIEPGRLEMIRARAHVLSNDLPAARSDLEAAGQAAPGKQNILYLLGQVREQMGDTREALDAYLNAAAAPYQESSTQRDAYVRLFVNQGLGSVRDAEQNLLKRAGENSQRTAAAYTPLPMTHPAQDFSFTGLSGKRFDRRAAKGKPLILAFWSIWCAPCVAELPAIETFQNHHQEANVLAVEIGHSAEEVKSFLASRHLANLHVALSAEWPRDLGIGAIPAAIVIDKFSQIQFVHTGQLAGVDAILGKDLAALPKPDVEKSR